MQLSSPSYSPGTLALSCPTGIGGQDRVEDSYWKSSTNRSRRITLSLSLCRVLLTCDLPTLSLHYLFQRHSFRKKPFSAASSPLIHRRFASAPSARKRFFRFAHSLSRRFGYNRFGEFAFQPEELQEERAALDCTPENKFTIMHFETSLIAGPRKIRL